MKNNYFFVFEIWYDLHNFDVPSYKFKINCENWWQKYPYFSWIICFFNKIYLNSYDTVDWVNVYVLSLLLNYMHNGLETLFGFSISLDKL